MIYAKSLPTPILAITERVMIMMTLNTELEASRLYEDMFGKKYLRGGIAYKVQANDGFSTIHTIIHGTDGDEVFRKAQCAITSSNGIFFDITIADATPYTPISIAPSQYIKPNNFGVAL